MQVGINVKVVSMKEPNNGVWKAKFAQQTSLFAAA